MALPVDPIAAATLAFTLAAKAWTTFQTALRFSDDADDLLLRLDLEQARFHLWSRNTDYNKVGDSFDQCLLPVIGLVDSVLKKITELFESVNQLRTCYGLTITDSDFDDSKKLRRFLVNLNKALHVTGMRTASAPEDDNGDNESAAPPQVRRAST